MEKTIYLFDKVSSKMIWRNASELTDAQLFHEGVRALKCCNMHTQSCHNIQDEIEKRGLLDYYKDYTGWRELDTLCNPDAEKNGENLLQKAIDLHKQNVSNLSN